MPDEVFKDKIRLRVNGILQKDDALLLVQLRSPVTNQLIWMPPGGGVKFGESMKEGLEREFFEETGLRVRVGSLVFFNEMIKPPFHAVECYFKVEQMGGTLRLGHDPELEKEAQVLKDLRWMPLERLQSINLIPEKLKHWISEPTSENRCSFNSSKKPG